MVDPTVMFKHYYGLYIVSSKDEEGAAACLVNTVTQVTAEPIQVVVSVNKDNVTCGRIAASGHFAVTVLDESADMPFIGRFGFRSSADIDKFEGLSCATDEFGDVYTTDHCCGMCACAVRQTVDAGTHLVFLGEVVETRDLGDGAPMTYSYYHTTLKGKTPPKAASYVAE